MADDERSGAVSKSGVIVLDTLMVETPVWLSLSRTAMQVYLLFRTKCVIDTHGVRRGKRSLERIIVNNGEIEFTYIEAKQKYGITPGRFVRAIDELVEKGFLYISETGMGLYKMTTHYGISERWRDYEKSSFREMHRPERSIKGGFCKGNKLWQKAKRKKSTAIRAHNAMRKNAHGEILAMRTDVHGQKVINRYNFCDGRWLCKQIA
jgi:hypothetical protein